MKFILSFLLAVYFANSAFSQSVIFHADPDQNLATRWSSSYARGAELRSDFWIGYSFPRLMEESEYVGSDIRFEGDVRMSGIFRGKIEPDSFIGKPLVEILGEKGSSFSESSRKKVMKRIAIVHLVRAKIAKPTVQSMQIGNVDLPFELRSLPLIWLGETDPAQSFDHLEKEFQTSTKELQEKIIHAIAVHPLPDRVVRFVKNVVANNSLDDDLKKAAVYALSDQDDGGVVSFLQSLAFEDAREELAKAACYALGDIHNPESSKALSSIARQASRIEIRKAALYAIADHRDEEAKSLLLSVASADSSEELSKAAIYALADALEFKGAEVLYDVQRTAKSAEVKKAAIYALADIEGPETVDVLAKVLKTETDPELRKATVYALADVESDKAIDVILDVAANDKYGEVRKAAIYALGDIDSPKAKAALIKMLKDED